MPRHSLVTRLLFLTLLAGCSADRLVVGENREAAIDAKGATQHLLRAGERTIDCWTIRTDSAVDAGEPAACVLFFVGKSDRADRWIAAVAGAWAPCAVEVWAMNYPGSGASTGPPSLSVTASNALALYDHVRGLAPGKPVYLHAASFGTAPALHVAANRGVAGLVLFNPPPLRQLLLGHYGWWNLWLLAGPVASAVPRELDSLANARGATAPVVFVSAGKDSIIPARYHRQIIRAYAGPTRTIEMPYAGHDSPLTREAAEQFRAGLDWLWSAR